jgi:hypothetical protein
MACVNCGVQTEPEVYICDKCKTDAQSHNQIGASIAIFASSLNTMDEGDPAVLDVENPRTTDTLNLFIPHSQQRQRAESLTFSLVNLDVIGAGELQSSFVRMLKNMGVPLDLEKPTPILSDPELILIEKVIRAVSDLENKYPDLTDINLFLLVGSLYYSFSTEIPFNKGGRIL